MKTVAASALCAALSGVALALPGDARTGPAILEPGTHRVSLAFDGRQRSYVVTVPPRASGAVILNFHGGGSTAQEQRLYTRMDEDARRGGFVAVYPESVRGAWNAGTCCGYAARAGVDDVGFALAIVDDLSQRVDVDRRRVYATGMSNGAMLAYRLAVEASDAIAAIAPVAGGMVVREFRPTRAVPILHFHSVDDPRAPYEGGRSRPGVVHPAIDDVIGRWARFEGCPAKPRAAARRRADDQTATRFEHRPCRAGSEVALWKLTKAGHVWPGPSHTKLRLGRSTTVVDANGEMWRFFQRHPLPR